jgi:hypothetical protein
MIGDVIGQDSQDNSGEEVVDDDLSEFPTSPEKFMRRLIECGFIEVEANNGREDVLTYRLTGGGIKFLEKMCALMELFCDEGDVIDNLPEKLV